jgi:hypothetical protein
MTVIIRLWSAVRGSGPGAGRQVAVHPPAPRLPAQGFTSFPKWNWVGGEVAMAQSVRGFGYSKHTVSSGQNAGRSCSGSECLTGSAPRSLGLAVSLVWVRREHLTWASSRCRLHAGCRRYRAVITRGCWLALCGQVSNNIAGASNRTHPQVRELCDVNLVT